MSNESKITGKIGIAFALVVTLMITIVVIHTYYLKRSVHHLDQVVGVHNVQMSLMNSILDLARQRSLTLQTMLLNADPFMFDDQVLRMSQIAIKYQSLSQQLRELPLTDEETELLDKQHMQSVRTGQLQSRIMKLMSDGDYVAAKLLFYEQASPSQEDAMDLMNSFIVIQDEQNNRELRSTWNNVKLESTVSLILLLIGFVISILIAGWVASRIRKEIDRRNRIERELESRVDSRTREVEALSKLTTEKRMQTLFDTAPEFIFVINGEGIILQTNKYAIENSGYSEDEIIGNNIKQFFTEESKQICDCTFPNLKEQGNSRSDIEFVCKDRRVINMECAATAVPDENGDFTSFMVIQRDVTANRQAARALADSERRFRTLFNSTYHFICVLDPEGNILEANRTLLEFVGHEAKNVAGNSFCQTIAMGSALNDMKPMYNAIVRAILGDLVHLEMELKRTDGSDVTVDFSLVPVKNDEGQPFLIIAEGRDITERKKNEEEAKQHLRDSAHFLRLNAMGEMASGMAHELNQPLTAIGSYCESATSMIAELPAANGELKDILMRATQQAHRAGGIIRHLRGFVGKEDSVKEPVDIDVLIYKLVKFVSWEIQKSGIEIEIITGCHGHNVLANKIQIEQVVLNLLMNSMEAIEDAEIDKAKLVLQTRIKHDDVVELTVTDNGPGMDASILDLAFDPFQTSKIKGMGLGLSICRSIIETHGGKLWIDEKYQDGARLGFELPVYETAHDYET